MFTKQIYLWTICINYQYIYYRRKLLFKNHPIISINIISVFSDNENVPNVFTNFVTQVCVSSIFIKRLVRYHYQRWKKMRRFRVDSGMEFTKGLGWRMGKPCSLSVVKVSDEMEVTRGWTQRAPGESLSRGAASLWRLNADVEGSRRTRMLVDSSVVDLLQSTAAF